jgi:tetratricopeptide (TPR) repeat protein
MTMKSASALTLPDCDRLVHSASELQSRGDYGGAERLLRQALNAFPSHPHGLHMAGILAHISGLTELGFRLIERAIEGNPSIGLFFANAGEMARMLGNKKMAISMGKRAVELEPQNANAWSNLGIALYDDGQLDEAERCHQKALEIDGAHTGSLNNLGSIWHARKSDDKAIGFYESTLKVNSSQVDALNNLGSIMLERKQLPKAVNYLEAALCQRGDHLGALCNLARAYSEIGKPVEAAPLLERAMRLAPEALHVLWASASYYQSVGEYELALKQADRALRLFPRAWELGALRADLLASLDRTDEATAELKKMVQDGVGPAKELTLQHADMLAANGDSQAVIELLEPMTQEIRNEPAYFYHRVMAQKISADSPIWTEMSAMSDPGGLTSTRDKLFYHFAMAKALDDLGQAEQAFTQYQLACDLKRSQFDYQVETDELFFESMASALSAQFISRLKGGGHSSHAPIFIVGMMRSGTSLMEQIIASHPEVSGAGELPDFVIATQEFSQMLEKWDFAPVAHWFNQIDPAQLQAWGNEYLQRAARRVRVETRFVDKLPMNFKLLGLIHLVFPNAKIIHMKRDPVDTCWSCYTQYFGSAALAFTFNLAEMGRYYRAYEGLMAHWRRVLPSGAMLEVQYEDLVERQEEVSRQVLAYCGLEWNDACLQFHKTERTIRTASQYQVKQPMNKSSVQRSRKYEPWLGELITALNGEGA